MAREKNVDRRRRQRSPEVNKFIKEFGFHLRKLRNDKGWTLEDVEEYGYPSWRHWQQVELGNRAIEISTVYNLASALNIPPWKLFKF